MSTTQSQKLQSAVGAPQISNEELLAFFQGHFSRDATSHFGDSFMNPAAESLHHADEVYEEWVEEDDLGYYEDGVKRTLTDEQIEIFRHSELETLRREQDKGPKRKAPMAHDNDDAADDDQYQILQEASLSSSFQSNDSKKKKRKSAKRPKPEPKPDLRKRTWDVVEAGLDSLDYD